jgi:Concanavalin A-like lectin/glucanases superfamily
MSRYPGRILSSTAPTVNANTAKGIWTLDEALRYSRAGQWPVPTGNGDPYFQYNTMLLPGQGTNGAQNNTFLDSSTNNFTITRNGNTTQGTFTPFSGADGNWSTFLNGSSSLSVNVSGISAGTSTFTLEFWVYLTAYPGADVPFVDTRSANGASTTAFQFGVYSTGKLKFYDGTETNLNGSVPLNQWTHIALVRDSGNTVTAYINGVSTGTTVSSTRNFSDNYFWIASVPAPASPYLNGYLSNLRWVVGSAVYTSAFTPPTSPLTAITNTKLLTLQSNRFVDNSANAYAITLNSTPQITPFQPFGAPTNAYSASTIGGSAYSDGSGDYLTVASNANLTLGSSDFTIELWWYPLAFNSDSEILTMASSGGTNRCFAIYSNASNGTLLAFAGTGSTSWDIVSSLSMGTAKQYAWNHIAFTRSGSTFSTYLNGARIATTTASGTLGSSGLGILANNSGTSQAPSSYISGVRTIKGTALYTGTTYTVPTEPPTAVTNTNFLANFTNAGIIDNAQDNNLETVGGAQISTTQYKWGASSVAFDGTTDYLIPNGSTTNLFAFGSGAFTIEMWFYVTSFPNQYVALYDSRPASTNGFYPVISLENNGSVYFYVNSANAISSGSGVISTNRWYHLAVVKAGSSTKMFVNGNQVGSTYADTNTYLIAANRPVIGAGGFTLGNDSLNGYIADLRITKGYARYPYNFTAPTAALPLFYHRLTRTLTTPRYCFRVTALTAQTTIRS